jgi:hypothetical protein
MLFAFFGLWESTLAVGAGAVAVPIIIHLLNRRRFKIVTWAAMRFLLAAQKQNSRRLRIEQLLLLLVRCLLVALLIFAMASVMPWAETLWAQIWPEGGGQAVARTTRTHHLFVLDGSLSMTTQVDGKSWFEAARDLALRKMDSCPSGDGFSILVMKDSPAWIVGEASADARKVKRELESLFPGHGNASVATTLNMVSAKLVEYGGRYPSQTVYFFTDLQKATWATSLNAPREGEAPKDDKERNITADIQQKARTVFVDVGRNDVPNLAVVDLSLNSAYALSGEETRFLTSVRNFADKPKANVKMEVLIGKAKEAAGDGPLTLRSVGNEFITVVPGEPRTVEFAYKFPSAGTYVVQVKLDADPLELDNVRSMVITVKDTIPVLLVDGKPAADRFEKATEYLRLALNPFRPGTEPKFAPLRPKVVNVAQFQDMPEAELAAFDCIFLADLAQVGPVEARRLEGHIRRGGGLVVAMGDKAADNLEAYNRFFYREGQGLLPAEMVKKVTAPAEHHFALQAQEADFDGPPLREFSGEAEKASLGAARFRTYVQTRRANDLRARAFLTFRRERADKAAPDASVPDNDLAFIEWNPPLPRIDGPRPAIIAPRMRGKVMLFTSSLNLDWSSWPGSPTYGALMQEATRFAMTGRLREQSSPVGTPLEEYLPAAGGELEALLHLPQLAPGQKVPKVRTQLVDDVNVFRYSDTDLSGIYRLALITQPLEIPYAINVPSSTADQRGSESDLSRLDKETLQALFPGWEFQYVFDPLAAQVQGGAPVAADVDILADRTPVGPDIARKALWLVLALLFAEVVIAWKFGHYTTVEGTHAQPATGLFWPLAAAAVATTVFALGAFVLWHDSSSGDFLSFLPDSIRARFEALMEVPPPPAGEMTHWELERAAVFLGASDNWVLGLIGAVSILMVVLIYLAEAPTVHPIYKLLLASIRLFLVFTTLAVFLPQLQLRIDRQGWPDLVFLIDTSRSMGEPDVFQDDKVRKRAKELGERIQKQVAEKLPGKIQALEAELASKEAMLDKNPALKSTVEELQQRLTYLQTMSAQIQAPGWRPTRLQLAQALLLASDRDWLTHFVAERRMKVHLYHLDLQGRATKFPDLDSSAADINDNTDPTVIDKAKKGIMNLDADGRDSRLGSALRQVVDHYRGANLAAVVMFTDGVTTRDETIGQFAEYSAQKGVPLFFVGIGDDREVRDLRLHDLQCEDTVYVKDRIIFEARLTGQGYKDLTVPVVLKVKEKDGKERPVGSTNVKVDPSGKSVKLRLTDRPDKVGRRTYIIEVEPPKADGADKQPHPSNLRLERTIDVLETKLIKVLLIDGQPRYEFRFLKFLLEREAADNKENKSVDVKVLLFDADTNFATTDKYAISAFPSTPAALAAFDVIVLGDVNPKSFKPDELKNLANFVRGGDAKAKTGDVKGGGGLLVIGGPMFTPHAYKNTPLADVLPIEPLKDKPPPEPIDRVQRLRLELTPVGRQNPIFRFVPEEAANQEIWQKLAPMYWWATGFKLKPLAEVLAVHPTEKADVVGPGQDGRLPLAVHQFVGSGRSLFYGFEESWRWRYREDEARYGQFWVQTLRFLARGRSNRTDLRLDRQTPYRVGEPIKVTVRFPESMPLPGDKAKPEVKVRVEYRPNNKQDGPVDPEISYLQLAKVEGSLATFEDQYKQTREGKYRFRLQTPDVPTPDGEKPSSEAVVELPPGELDRLRMNYQEMTQAAEQTQGKFYTLSNADAVPDDVPPGMRISLSSPRPPQRLWNHWTLFVWAMFLLTCEWLLRKRKHLL